MQKTFNMMAAQYDRWFDSQEGKDIFGAELECLYNLTDAGAEQWLEVGVGTGRFAEALDVDVGLDTSIPMLEFAKKRGIEAVAGAGEYMPYHDSCFDGVLMVTALCFMSDPPKVFMECSRVLKRMGLLVLGIVPSDSAWGRLYERKGSEGHPYYSNARFYTCRQIIQKAGYSGFVFDKAMSCLFGTPEMVIHPRSVKRGIIMDAGFVAMRFILDTLLN
ncbi:class I SAM-dependent methyltransferase [bacterium]|nr:class I SAM-dependent methyltransferase [bacterium]